MLVTVHMLSSERLHLVRYVEITAECAEATTMSMILDDIFHWGQNDFQPQERVCSLSVGDVIEYGGNRYLICRGGFRCLTSPEFMTYLKTDRDQRMLSPLLDQDNL